MNDDADHTAHLVQWGAGVRVCRRSALGAVVSLAWIGGRMDVAGAYMRQLVECVRVE